MTIRIPASTSDFGSEGGSSTLPWSTNRVMAQLVKALHLGCRESRIVPGLPYKTFILIYYGDLVHID